MDGSLAKAKSNSFALRTNRKRKYSTHSQCENCDVSPPKLFFYSISPLKNATNLNKFKCKFCDKIYAKDIIFNAHMLLQHPKDYDELQQELIKQQQQQQSNDNAIERLNELIFRETPPNTRRRCNSCSENFHHLRQNKYRESCASNQCDNLPDDFDFSNTNLIDALLCGIDRRLWRTMENPEPEDDRELLRQSITGMPSKLQKFIDVGTLSYAELRELLNRMVKAYQSDKQAMNELSSSNLGEFKPKYWFFHHMDSFVQLIEGRKKHRMLKISLRVIAKQPYDEKVFSEEEILVIIEAFRQTPILWNTTNPLYNGQLGDEETLFRLWLKLSRNHRNMPLLNPTLLCVQLMQLETYYSAEKYLRERNQNTKHFVPRFAKIFVSLNFLWPHVPPFPCSNCGRIFELEDSYRNHNLLDLPCPLPDRKPQPFVCRICGKSYASKENLEIHLRRHETERAYDCNQCGRNFENYAKLLQHRRTHFFSQTLKCNNCGIQFPSLKVLRLHRIVTRHYRLREPHNLTIYCDWCNQRLLNEFYLRYHRELHENNIQCEHDQTGFESTDCEDTDENSDEEGTGVMRFVNTVSDDDNE